MGIHTSYMKWRAKDLRIEYWNVVEQFLMLFRLVASFV